MPSHTSLRAAAVGLVLGLVAALSVPVLTAPAQASSIYHCSGWQACENAGYSTAGYINAHNKMYWQMYAGHNCTNYVAYRMIKAGMSTTKPWSGTGMAYNWGRANRSITDQTPAVGAVAWWDSRAAGMSSSGHVAYVEKVISPTRIVISEDAWSGTFRWRTVIKDGSSWPSGFIHFIDKQKPLVSKGAPGIDGTAQVGSTLRANSGAWNKQAKYSFQWLADGAPIAGATAATYVPRVDVLGKRLSARVTARKDGFADGVATSPATSAVVKGDFTPTATPSVTGEALVGSVLTVGHAAWTPRPNQVRLRWLADGRVIKDATAEQLTLTEDLVGKSIAVQEVVLRGGFNKATSPTSNAIGPVIRGVIGVDAPSQASGSARHGSTLALSKVTPTTAGTTMTVTWLRDGAAVPGASAATYRLTKADVGHRMVAQLSITKPGWREYRRTFNFGLVTAPTKLVVRPRGRKRAALLVIRLSAPGTVPTGWVRAKVAKHEVVGKVVDGVLRLRVQGLGVGERHVKVTYAGNRVSDPALWRGTVQVKP